mgnify:CR=1 FL=1|tara:strand:- start:886 stop:2100 length:1215 start_codon:yes stop_codon:yes gene_type:complete
MKLFKVLTVNFALLIGSVEIISFIFLKENVRTIFPEYWRSPLSFGRGYPQYHFIENLERGFDIAYNSKKVSSHVPREIQPYFVWGNHIGCFDENIDNQSRYAIYLAGDSFTWGYAPLENKFGTKLENELGVNVAACGVTHTGQQHQFQKFKEIFQKLGYYPEVAFVNVTDNDIDNDFSHPHSTIIQGYMVDNVKINVSDKSFFITKLDNDFLNSKLSKLINRGSYAFFGRLDPRKYSMISVLLIDTVYKPLLSLMRTSLLRTSTSQSNSEISRSVSVYGVTKYISEDSDFGYPINSPTAKNNRKVIKEWIQHAVDNAYNLIFVDVQTQFFNYKSELLISKVKDKQFFCDFIKKQGSECFSFVNYLDDIGIKNWENVIWKNDLHLNFKGNQLYADFLTKIYKEIE